MELKLLMVSCLSILHWCRNPLLNFPSPRPKGNLKETKWEWAMGWVHFTILINFNGLRCNSCKACRGLFTIPFSIKILTVLNHQDFTLLIKIHFSRFLKTTLKACKLLYKFLIKWWICRCLFLKIFRLRILLWILSKIFSWISKIPK